ncbi:hypothetical protein Scep_023639 [Stephania cephalantha]|uniref:DNA-3-methyladenine glycosylase I n=1 Tax=Stephania cephalantha TaxID=152367 RepID=A0AAP0F401_9MAGN
MSINVGDPEMRPVLVPAGNKERLLRTKKPASKPLGKAGKTADIVSGEGEKLPLVASSPRVRNPLGTPSILRKQEMLLHLSLDASCSSDASSESLHSRASTGRITRSRSLVRSRSSGVNTRQKKQCFLKPEMLTTDSDSSSSTDVLQVKKRCAWVTSNSDPCYAAFHDEEWGVPVHDDKKLFELLVLAGALAEHTWPTILGKRHLFREVFVDFDPVAVSNLNERKITAPGSTASSLLSEQKLRAVIENACQISKIKKEFGSFDKYIWSFVNHKPIISRFRYPRQVPAKTPKADVISKDLVRRGFRSVGPTVIYSFMQVAGITNDHLFNCFRFDECIPAISTHEHGDVDNSKAKAKEKNIEDLDIGLASAMDELGIASN